MNPAKTLGAVALVAFCFGTAACGGSQHPATSDASASPAPAGCASAISLIPSSPPNTAQQAADDENSIAGDKAGTTVAALRNQVAADLLQLSADLSMHQGTLTADLSTYQADVSKLRSYCS
jgi:hypothetical protein